MKRAFGRAAVLILSSYTVIVLPASESETAQQKIALSPKRSTCTFAEDDAGTPLKRERSRLYTGSSAGVSSSSSAQTFEDLPPLLLAVLERVIAETDQARNNPEATVSAKHIADILSQNDYVKTLTIDDYKAFFKFAHDYNLKPVIIDVFARYALIHLPIDIAKTYPKDYSYEVPGDYDLARSALAKQLYLDKNHLSSKATACPDALSQLNDLKDSHTYRKYGCSVQDLLDYNQSLPEPFVYRHGTRPIYYIDNRLISDLTGLKNIPGIDAATDIVIDAFKLNSIQPFSFNGLKQLSKLSVSHHIKDIECEAFIGLDNLTTLKINFTEIRHIAAETFKGLKNLQELDLSFNQIEHIDPGAFTDLGHLTVLRLAKNNIESLRANTCSGLKKLRELFIQSNKIVRIEPGAFVGLPNLEGLCLIKNQITEISAETFIGLEKSKRGTKKKLRIAVTDNPIQHISEDALAGKPIILINRQAQIKPDTHTFTIFS